MQRLRIVVAEDDCETRDRVVRLLSTNYEVVGTAGDGASLLEAAARLRPDVLVVDIGMPVMNGIEAIRKYRSASGAARIVVLSNYSESDLVEAALGSGADAFVAKMRAAEELVPAIDR